MKKSLIALAVLAASGASMAQSSVTLYGLVDAYVGQTSREVTSSIPASQSAKLKQTVVNPSGQNNSRWGLKGTEDLGGGMKALFVLEGGFNPDTGTFNNISNQGGGLFGRQAWVGLQSSFGTVGLGRQYPAYDDLRGATNMIYDSNFATTGTVWGTGLQDYQNRSSNAIKYISPDFGGFSGAVSYGFGENKTATADAEGVAAVMVKYSNGPLMVGYAHQREKQVAGGNLFGTGANVGVVAGPAAFNSTRKYNLLGASYDLGVAKLTGQYNQAKGQTGLTTSASDKEFNVGVSVPFGAAAIAAGYSRSKSEAAGNNNKGQGLSLLGTYALSKRTNLYTGYLVTKVESQNAATETKASTFGLGVKHLF
ncbi:MAG: porin, Gram-negative type [Polaromonas sp.]|jgi:predicted porin|nr:porin, Gram-negative type [Polaromonas sp.]